MLMLLVRTLMIVHLNGKNTEEEEELKEGKTNMLQARGKPWSSARPEQVGVPEGGEATQGRHCFW